MNKRQICIAVAIAFLTLFLFASFITNSSATIVNVDETLPPNSTWVHPSNFDENKTVIGMAYGQQSYLDVFTSVPQYTEVLTGDDYSYDAAAFEIYPMWTFTWMTHGMGWTNISTIFNDSFAVGDRVRNAEFTVKMEEYGGATGVANYHVASTSGGYSSWYYAPTPFDAYAVEGSYVDTQTLYGTAMRFVRWRSGYGVQTIGTQWDLTVPVDDIHQNSFLKTRIRWSDSPCLNTIVWNVVSDGILVYNYRTATWDWLLHNVFALTWRDDTLTFWDAGTGKADSYLSTYPNVETPGGKVTFKFVQASIAQSVSIVPCTVVAGVYVDFCSVEQKGYDDVGLSENLDFQINGYDSSDAHYDIPDSYMITTEDYVGPYTYTSAGNVRYGGIWEFDLGKVPMMTGSFYYENTDAKLKLLCGSTSTNWVLTMTKEEVNKAISGGFFTNNWTHEIGGIPQSTEVSVTSAFSIIRNNSYFLTAGVLDESIEYDTKDLDLSLTGFYVNGSNPDVVELQTVDVTSSCFFTPEELFPFGILMIPSTITYPHGSVNTVLLQIDYDVTPPSTPSSATTKTSAGDMDEIKFTVVPSDEIAYCFIVYNDSGGGYYFNQMPTDYAGGFSVKLRFHANTYCYWYYLIDENGNVRTTEMVTLKVSVITTIKVNVNGLLSWVAVIAVIIGGAVLVSQTKYKKNSWIYIGLIGGGAAILVIMSLFGLFPVTLNLLALETAGKAISPFYMTIGYTILGVGIGIAVVAGYFILKYLTKPSE